MRGLVAVMCSVVLAAGAAHALGGTNAPMRMAQEEQKPEACPPLLAWRTPLIIPAAVPRDHLRLRFVGHATFVIESPLRVRAATDYNDYVRPDRHPDIITMNRAHRTHFTDSPPAETRHVLRGWDPAGAAADHDVTLRDMRVRNVVTNLRGWGGGTDLRGNSIFVFEASLLCVAHLGHLHHELTEEHLKQLGRIDIALAPIDGSMTLNREAMLRVVRAMDAPVVIPMHFFRPQSVEEFVTLARGQGFDIRYSQSPEVVLSRDLLPRRPTVLVLPGR